MELAVFSTVILFAIVVLALVTFTLVINKTKFKLKASIKRQKMRRLR